MTSTAVTVTEQLEVSTLASPRVVYPRTIHELAIVRGTLSRLYRMPVTVRERVSVRAVMSAGSRYGLTLRSALALRASVNAGHLLYLRAAMALTSRLTAAQVVTLRETLRLTARAALSSFYAAALRDSVRLVDRKPTIALGMLLRSRAAFSANLTKTLRMVATLGEELALAATLTPKLVIVVVSRDSVHLTTTELLRGIYNATLTDTIDFIVDVVSPSGDTTTWAMNTRTGAVTEYLDYSFNAFAQSVDGVYLGADATGLYELRGADDAGQPVVADLISGLTDFSGAFLTGFKAAYLGLRGSGQFFLKLTAGDGKTYVYGVQASSLASSRVNLGKGLRAKYFTWELISTGQDFDLGEIVFLPIQSTRRV